MKVSQKSVINFWKFKTMLGTLTIEHEDSPWKRYELNQTDTVVSQSASVSQAYLQKEDDRI